MDTKIKKIKLTEKDRKTISTNQKICTESHGEGCGVYNPNEKDKNLN